MAHIFIDHGAESGPIPDGAGEPCEDEDRTERARIQSGTSPTAHKELAEGCCPAQQDQQTAAAATDQD